MKDPIELLSPYILRGASLRNRIAVSPMCQYSCVDGFATDWHLVHLGSRASGGAGLVMVEATAVTPEGRISPGDMGIYTDAHVEPLARVARFVLSQGAVPAIQLAHAGRKASCREPWAGGGQIAADAGGWETVAPSPLPFNGSDRAPRELDEAGIKGVLDAFVTATKRALDAGFRLIELHAAHGYLLHEFLSPLSNQRTDQWGGSLENRMRLAVETARAMRAVMPDAIPLFVRISATDWYEGGWNESDSVELARKLKEVGVDLIDVSSGALTPLAKIPVAPGFQVPFARKIRHEAGIATGAVGLITTVEQANAILIRGDADIVSLAREMLREPYWALKAYKELAQEPPWPLQYGYAIKRR